MTREELLKSPEYWKVEIQMELHEIINDYMDNNKINRKQLADKFGFTKGYITQILNGEYNHRLSKLVELALSVGKVPVIEFVDLEQTIRDDMYKQVKKSNKEISSSKRKKPLINRKKQLI